MSPTSLDPDGQPVVRAFNWHRNLAKSTSALIGLCSGLVADQVLNDGEITFLDTWLAENADVAASFPGNIIADRLHAVLADGVVTEDERADLMETLTKVSGGAVQDHGVASGMATRLGVEEAGAAEIEIPGRAFCFTGKFVYGPRARCESAVADRGGRVISGVTRELDYLVIGTLASRDWAHTSHGRKIEKAQAMRADGHSVLVLGEEVWVRRL